MGILRTHGLALAHSCHGMVAGTPAYPAPLPLAGQWAFNHPGHRRTCSSHHGLHRSPRATHPFPLNHRALYARRRDVCELCPPPSLSLSPTCAGSRRTLPTNLEHGLWARLDLCVCVRLLSLPGSRESNAIRPSFTPCDTPSGRSHGDFVRSPLILFHCRPDHDRSHRTNCFAGFYVASYSSHSSLVDPWHSFYQIPLSRSLSPLSI